MKDYSQYSDIIEVDNQKYLAQTITGDTENLDETLIMHQELENLLKCQVETLQNQRQKLE